MKSTIRCTSLSTYNVLLWTYADDMCASERRARCQCSAAHSCTQSAKIDATPVKLCDLPCRRRALEPGTLWGTSCMAISSAFVCACERGCQKCRRCARAHACARMLDRSGA
jgi:hypothetical protein